MRVIRLANVTIKRLIKLHVYSLSFPVKFISLVYILLYALCFISLSFFAFVHTYSLLMSIIVRGTDLRINRSFLNKNLTRGSFQINRICYIHYFVQGCLGQSQTI